MDFCYGGFAIYIIHNHSGVLYTGIDYEFELEDIDTLDGIAQRTLIVQHRADNAKSIVIRKEFPENWIFENIEKYARFKS